MWGDDAVAEDVVLAQTGKEGVFMIIFKPIN